MQRWRRSEEGEGLSLHSVSMESGNELQQTTRDYISHLFLTGEVYILANSKTMAQSHSGKLYKLVDPKR